MDVKVEAMDAMEPTEGHDVARLRDAAAEAGHGASPGERDAVATARRLDEAEAGGAAAEAHGPLSADAGASDRDADEESAQLEASADEAEASAAAEGEGAEGPPADPFAQVAEALERWSQRRAEQMEARKRALKLLDKLRRDERWRAPVKLGKWLEEARAALPEVHGQLSDKESKRLGFEKLLERLEGWHERLLEGLAVQACYRELLGRARAEGVPLRIVDRKRPLRLRLHPFEVVLDEAKDEATLCFAEDRLRTVPLAAQAIWQARAELLEELHAGFAPRRFFEALLTAYRQALAARPEGRFGDAVELQEVLPLLALQMQPERLRRSLDPMPASRPKGHRPYTRGHFAYHLWQLQAHRALAQGGYRLTIGAATGTSGHDRKRSLLLEDGDGHGERKLTLAFRRHEKRPEPGGPPDEAPREAATDAGRQEAPMEDAARGTEEPTNSDIGKKTEED